MTTDDLVAAIRGLPANAGPGTGAARRLRAAWERAPALARSQAALLLLADGGSLPFGLTADRLPRALALATLASAEEWAGSSPAEAEAQAVGVLRRLEAAGFPVADLAPLDAVAAAWLPGPAGAGTHTAMIAHAADLVAGDPPTSAATSLARGLLAAARRAWLAERHGLALPDEFRRAFAGMSLSEAVAASGIAKATLSRVMNGQRRTTDAAALWILRRLEEREEPDKKTRLECKSPVPETCQQM